MKIGIKIFTEKDEPLLKKLLQKTDFIETMAVQGQDYSFLKNYSRKIVIHAEHQQFGVNPADSSKTEENLKSINFAVELANSLNAEKIICHPGFIANKNCSEKNAIDFFKKINDKRVIIENMHSLGYNINPITALCTTPESTEKFLKQTGNGFCLDISHAVVAALLLKKKNYNEFITPFFKLKPLHFHFSDVSIKKILDHLALGEGNLDIESYKKLIPENAEVTLETAVNAEKLLNDIRIMNA